MELNKPSWDDYFMAMACVACIRSPDPATKHGCVITDVDHRPLGIGYNGFPRGGISDYPTTRPEKYDYMVHSELNAILNCIHRPEGGTVYVTGVPCPKCMITMVQAGVKRIVYGQIGSDMVPQDVVEKTMSIASNHNIKMEEYKLNPASVLQDVMRYTQDLKGWK